MRKTMSASDELVCVECHEINILHAAENAGQHPCDDCGKLGTLRTFAEINGKDEKTTATRPEEIKGPDAGTPKEWRKKARHYLEIAAGALKSQERELALIILDESIRYAWAADILHGDAYWAEARAIQHLADMAGEEA